MPARAAILDLLRGHTAFLRDHPPNERDFLKRLASEGQNPSAFYVGCSDSRVVPELLTTSGPGDLFVVRNVANLVPPHEHVHSSVGAALEYAVSELKVSHAIVCGHYGCGGIKAAYDGPPSHLPTLRDWLRRTQGDLDPIRGLEDQGVTPEAALRLAVETNVVLQLENLLTYPGVEAAIREDRLAVHGWVYDMHTLELAVFDPEYQGFRTAQDLLRDPSLLPPPIVPG